jgi:hypothetical protein
MIQRDPPVDFCMEANPIPKKEYKCVRNGKTLDLSPKDGPKWIGRHDEFMCEWSNITITSEEDQSTGARSVTFTANVNAPWGTSGTKRGPFNVGLQFHNGNARFPHIKFEDVRITKKQPTISLSVPINVDVLRATALDLSVGQGCWKPD